MKAARRISLPAHGLVELVIGLALVVASMALDLGAAGAVITFAAGVLLAGVGLGAAESMPLAAHHSLDLWLVTLLAAGSIVAAYTGSGLAAVVLLTGAATQLALTGLTRWTRVPAAR